jgi:hypothetical protein
MNTRTSLAQREESIRRTVYVSDIDQQVYKIKRLLVAIVMGYVCVSVCQCVGLMCLFILSIGH